MGKIGEDILNLRRCLGQPGYSGEVVWTPQIIAIAECQPRHCAPLQVRGFALLAGPDFRSANR